MSKVSWLSQKRKPDVLVTNEAAFRARSRVTPEKGTRPFPFPPPPRISPFDGAERREVWGVRPAQVALMVRIRTQGQRKRCYSKRLGDHQAPERFRRAGQLQLDLAIPV